MSGETRVYTFTGKVAHLLPIGDSPNYDHVVLCGREAGTWLGTGSQAEHKKATELPTCRFCAKQLAAATARVHDYRRRYWGHDYSLTPHADPATARITGWGLNLRVGDLLVIPRPGEGGKAAFYRIESLQYTPDPPDMWFTTCRFTPASSELGQRAIEAMAQPAVRLPGDVLAAWWEIPDGGETP